ncbi:MAG: glycosyltransferase [Candidatus Krumholzibacteria bacterium]|nr:glycosyltransferase [Candidatus Krumholzibacteria bacterium]
MRITLVGPAWPYRGGISHYNTCLAEQLCETHEIEVVNYSRLYPGFLFPGKTQYDESKDAHRVDSVRMIDSINPFTWVRTGFHLVRSRPDVVLVQWWHPYFAPAIFKICSIVRVFTKARIIFICHNVVPHEKSMVDRLLARLAFSTAHGFMVQSEEDRKNLFAMKKKAVAGIHPHPIYDFFKKGDTDRDEAKETIGEGAGNLVLFFGYIRAYKGLEFLIRSMSEVISSIPARLLVVGEFYEDREPYDRLVRELGLEDSVRFVDRYVENEEVQQYFSACDLVVLPYISATQSGIAQIAVAFDRPMVVTRVGGLPEVVAEGRTGFVVDAGDPSALADRIIGFFTEGMAEKMAPFFEEEKKRFSWESMVRALEGLIVRAGEGRG